MAEGGSLFLDEIGELAPDLQSKLLRVLQERELRPLGARHTVKVNVRLMASTNRDVLAAIESGSFRRDLYYRIQGAEIHVPSLRERMEDVPLLVQHFLRAGEGSDRQVSAEAMERLCRYPWPGNVRELENEVRRAVVLCAESVIGIEHLSPAVRDWTSSRAVGPPEEEAVRPLRDVMRDAIRRAMRRFGGRRQDVARALGISRTTLYLKLKEIEESAEDDGARDG
jgi:two-component system response regulator HydG